MKAVPACLFAMLVLLASFALPAKSTQAAAPSVEATYSSYNDLDTTYRFSPQAGKSFAGIDPASTVPTIVVDPSVTYQSWVGMGGSFEHTTLTMLSELTPQARESALQAMFHPSTGNGYNLMRLSIGCSDFCGYVGHTYQEAHYDTPFWTYDDNGGAPDPNLTNFSIQREIDAGMFDILRRALEINPNLKYFASMWSPPAWMKDNGSLINGGSVKPEYYGTLAQYYVKYIQAYEAQGIPIYAVTLQNEPRISVAYPSTMWTAEQQAAFAPILKQAFVEHGISTKLWGMDDNDYNAFPFGHEVLRNPAADAAIDGIAFHNYSPNPLTPAVSLAKQHPDKTMHVTELTTSADKIIHYLRHNISSYNFWLTFYRLMPGPGPGWFQDLPSADEDFYSKSSLSHSETVPGSYDLNARHYNFGHFSRYLKPGAVRIDSSERVDESLTNVAFRNPDGTIVMVVVNRLPEFGFMEEANTPAKTVRIVTPDGQFTDTIPGDTIATYRWTPGTGVALSNDGWSASASHTHGGYFATQALDDNVATHWTSGADQAAGQQFTLDLGAPTSFDQITLNMGSLPSDEPASYRVFVSDNPASWGAPVATGTGTPYLTNIHPGPQTKRYIRIELAAGTSGWWTIAHASVYDGDRGLLDREGWTAAASSTDGVNLAAAALDGNVATRWASGAAQTNGQWFTVDMGSAHTFNRIELDAGPNGGDYARGYVVETSNDGVGWSGPIAEGTGIAGTVTAEFPAQQARYIRVTQTGSAPSNWWSVAELRVYREDRRTLPRIGWTGTASAAGDPSSNAWDGNLATRWSLNEAQHDGQWIELDLQRVERVNGIDLHAGPSAGDYPRGYRAEVSLDGTNWTVAAIGKGLGQHVPIAFHEEMAARYLRVVQTGTAPANWWSIAELSVYGTATPQGGTGLSKTGWMAAASHTEASSDVARAFDGNLNTSWISGTAQASGQWYQIDLGANRTFRSIELHSGLNYWVGAARDYIRGYDILVNDGGGWRLVASGEGTFPVTRIEVPSTTARYVQIRPTAAADNWLAFDEINIFP